MVVLALLCEQPMHAYRMHELIKQRGKASVVNVAQRNSVYQTLARLVRAGLVAVHETSRAEGRPERVVYRATDEGRASVLAWIEQMLRTPAREFPEFPAAVSFLMMLAPDTARAALETRRVAIAERAARAREASEGALAAGLPRLFLLEDEYQEAIATAELAWLDRTIDELKSGVLTWSLEWIRAVAERVEPPA